jgi:predicted PurR-regulated permease PerM
MSSETIIDHNQPKPRWDITTKVLVIVILLILIGLAVYFFRIVFIPLIIGGIVAYLLQPVIRALSRATRLPRKVATTLLYLILLLLIVLLGAVLSSVLAAQAKGLADELTSFLAQAREQGIGEITILGFTFNTQALFADLSVADASAAIRDLIRATPFTFLPHATETALLIVFTILSIYYLTRDADEMLDGFQRLIPPQYQDDVRIILGEIDLVWAAFFRGQVILALVMMLVVTGVSVLLGLPQPFLLGVLAGLLEFLPSVGHLIWISIALPLALVTGSTWLPISNNALFALLVIGAYIAFTQFDLNFLIPRIIGERVRLHPLVVIGGIIIGARIGGVLGVALAAPTIATLRIFGRYIYALLFDMDPFPHITTETPSRPETDVTQPSLDISLQESK